ncbi:hypothetical protein [Acetobacter senegalensis]|uniref:hypothetical protein n=1 Tax=Acetobacter senegalensis TaxID=446692 RepID=UPI00073F1E60|nr:hypothetical protein [Acetobacter senegalensis]
MSIKKKLSGNDISILDALLATHMVRANWAATLADTSNLIKEGLIEMDSVGMFCRLTPLGLKIAKELQGRSHK